MHTLRLVRAFIKVQPADRPGLPGDTAVNILINLMWLGWELVGLSIIFANTDTLGGLGAGRADHPAGRSFRLA